MNDNVDEMVDEKPSPDAVAGNKMPSPESKEIENENKLNSINSDQESSNPDTAVVKSQDMGKLTKRKDEVSKPNTG